jgi:DNA-binding FadR family transcriptional regulator
VRTAGAANDRSRPASWKGTEDGDLVHFHLLHERLVNFSVIELASLNDLRQAISGTAAELAAERALVDDHELLEHRLGRLSTAEGVSALRRADTQLAIAIAAAAQSSVLADREMSLRAELGDLLWWQVDDAERAVALSERRKLVGAIEQGRAEVARKTCTRIITRETDRLVALRLARYRADAS